MLLLRQIGVLVYKNLLIAFVRRPITTLLRALVLPIFISWFFSYARNFFAQPALYGVGEPRPVRTLPDAFALTGSRNRLVFVNNGFEGGQIEDVINSVASVASAAGKEVLLLDKENDLLTACRNSLRGASHCIAGVVFHSSPTEPTGQNLPFNYTIRLDGILGANVFVNRDTNDQQVYLLPLQKAIDQAIANATNGVSANAVDGLLEFPFTSDSEDTRVNNLRLRYMRIIINYLAVAFFVGMCGIQYQQVGAQATEREGRMAQLLEVMMPNKRRWEPQLARLLSYHIAFSALYLPGWVILATILKIYVFARTSYGIVIGYHVLNGLALASWSLFAAAFFKRAQLSGITTILVSLVLGIIAQVMHFGDGAVYVCGLMFPSMNYVFFIVFMARFERRNRATVLTSAAPNTRLFHVHGIVFWIYTIIQIIIFPLLAIWAERLLWGTTSGRRHLTQDAAGPAVRLSNFSKHFKPDWFSRTILSLFGKKPRETVRAVDDLSISVHPGQIMLLLGANGSGKSTTLDAIAGLSKPTAGSIEVDFSNGLGFCPQQNVLWKDLTVYEHVDIFDRLKSLGSKASKPEKVALIDDCDLARKVHAKAGSLSGGQMRKLQLASMFIGKSRICLVDECSSGIDPLARRKIQDILLNERTRSKRTIIFTSHYLDESDIADYLLIMSKGKLKVHGTAPEIKQSGQYRIHVYHSTEKATLPHFPDVSRHEMYDQTVYAVDTASAVVHLLTKLEEQGFREYAVSGPTVEDAFMRVAEEMVPSHDNLVESNINFNDVKAFADNTPDTPEDARSCDSNTKPDKDLDLQTGVAIGPLRQGSILFWKRCQVFLRSVYPNATALIIVPVAAGLTSIFLENFKRAGCISQNNVYTDVAVTWASFATVNLTADRFAIGPRAAVQGNAIRLVTQSLPPNGSFVPTRLQQVLNVNFTYINTAASMYDYVSRNPTRTFPGGIAIGGSGLTPSIGYLTNPGYIYLPILQQNLVSILSYKTPIGVRYQPFAIPWQAGQGNTLQYCIYFGLVLCAAPAFFAVYPTLERIRKVRGLHYSNGVRSLPLWLSYTLFDFCFVLVGATIAVIILAARFGDIFFGLGKFWLVMVLYGLCATLCAYVVSLFASSTLAAFAIAAAYQAASLLLYLIAYLSLVTYGDPNYIDRNLHVIHFTLSLILPAGSLVKSLFVSINILSVNCRGTDQYVSSPGDITAYGGPILYLTVQSILLFSFLVWWESSGGKFTWLRRINPVRLWSGRRPVSDAESKDTMEPEVAAELERVSDSPDDGLRVLHLSKSYGRNLVVDDVSFGVQKGEVFGLLGPNGAGKSTTISLVRGDIKPTHPSSSSTNPTDIIIDSSSLFNPSSSHPPRPFNPFTHRPTFTRTLALQSLSACPQHDAMDRLTVTSHLLFYARIRGVPNPQHNVSTVIRAVGLGAFAHRMAEKLSGGNKRKLSLGIALMGNPRVMLLDEPSSGMDVAAKRVMWRTLEAVVGGRSIVLTTHSMEEADRLCGRAGILAKQMLAVGKCDDLKRRYGDRYYVHLLLRSAPYTDLQEEERVKGWVRGVFGDGVEVDEGSHHGQIRFSVPVRKEDGVAKDASHFGSHGQGQSASQSEKGNTQVSTAISPIESTQPVSRAVIATLFSTLERCKEEMAIETYSVSHATLDQVFLSIVGKHNIEEENNGNGVAGKRDGRWWRWCGWRS